MNTSNYTFFEKTIIDAIDFEGYNEPENMDLYTKIQTLHKTFKSEYVHDNNKHLSEAFLFSEWLSGLPSSCTVPFYNSEILQNGLLNGFDLSTENKEGDFLASYFKNLAIAFFTLKNNL